MFIAVLMFVFAVNVYSEAVTLDLSNMRVTKTQIDGVECMTYRAPLIYDSNYLGVYKKEQTVINSGILTLHVYLICTKNRVGDRVRRSFESVWHLPIEKNDQYHTVRGNITVIACTDEEIQQMIEVLKD